MREDLEHGERAPDKTEIHKEIRRTGNSGDILHGLLKSCVYKNHYTVLPGNWNIKKL
jgi:hypothetical protein